MNEKFTAIPFLIYNSYNDGGMIEAPENPKKSDNNKKIHKIHKREDNV